MVTHVAASITRAAEITRAAPLTTVAGTSTVARAAAIDWETRQFSASTPLAAASRRTTLVARILVSTVATVDDLLDEARSTYERVSARCAYQLVLHGRAVLVDTRPEGQRRAEGEVDPALGPVHVERNVLEWRLDPRSDSRLPWVTSESRVIVMCQQGYSSSFVAPNLVRLGLAYASDMVGGLDAWREAGLPLAHTG